MKLSSVEESEESFCEAFFVGYPSLPYLLSCLEGLILPLRRAAR